MSDDDLGDRIDRLFAGEEADPWTTTRQDAVRALCRAGRSLTRAALGEAIGLTHPPALDLVLSHRAFLWCGGRWVILSVAARKLLFGLPPAPDPLADVRRALAGCRNVSTAAEAIAHAIYAIAQDHTRREEAQTIRVRIAGD